MSEGDQGTTSSTCRATCRLKIEEVLPRAQPEVLRTDGGGYGVAGGISFSRFSVVFCVLVSWYKGVSVDVITVNIHIMLEYYCFSEGNYTYHS